MEFGVLSDLLTDHVLAFIAAQTATLMLSTSTTLITTNDPVKSPRIARCCSTWPGAGST